MQIQHLWMSQRNLRRIDQIDGMIKSLLNDEILPSINLCRCEDGEIQVMDGHHRLTAIWLSGRDYLEDYEYFIVESDWHRPRCGKITDLIAR